ncbi:MAG: hypothetical protein IJP31_08655 [Lachnospiraceae bacterium]|nr:hypothetical protein [Lachnospiraceae bacterium]
MRNLSNLLAVFALVAMMGLLVGCGCGTTQTPAKEDMVDTGEETVPPSSNTVNETVPGENTNNAVNTDHGTEAIVDEHGNLVDENAAENGVNNTVDRNDATNAADNDTDNANHTTNNTDNAAGNVIDDAGNMVGDVVEDAGDAVEDVGRGVRNMTNDATR